MPELIADKVLSRIYGSGRGKVFTPKDFLDLGSHASVRQVLARLEKQGTIRRLLRGVYDYPSFSRLLQAEASPDPDAIARAIARNHGWTILPSGETALNLLGLSRQVPAQWQYLSDGPSRRYKWRGGTLVFTHRTNRETSSLSPRTAILVQGLKALGRARLDDSLIDELKKRFDARDRARAVREAKYSTGWVYEFIRKLQSEGEQGA
jgi:hypothetical protein